MIDPVTKSATKFLKDPPHDALLKRREEFKPLAEQDKAKRAQKNKFELIRSTREIYDKFLRKFSKKFFGFEEAMNRLSSEEREALAELCARYHRKRVMAAGTALVGSFLAAGGSGLYFSGNVALSLVAGSFVLFFGFLLTTSISIFPDSLNFLGAYKILRKEAKNPPENIVDAEDEPPMIVDS